MSDVVITAPDESVTITAGVPAPIYITSTQPTVEIEAGGQPGPAGADSTVPGPQGPPGPQGVAGPQGAQGIQGAQGVWVQMTQAAYNALGTKDPNTLYVIVG